MAENQMFMVFMAVHVAREHEHISGIIMLFSTLAELIIPQ
jgi:hypothetical protein